MNPDILIHNCSQLLTFADAGLGLVVRGAVRIRAGRIADVGTDLTPQPGEQVLDAQGCVVMPGFVDPHTHLVFAGWRAEEFEMRLAGRSYKEIAEA
ncbi:MAG: amidohydrolase family protein, partial [candidate division WOR-3 bacterium]